MKLVLLSDRHRGSYDIIGEFYERSLNYLADTDIVHLPTPKGQEEREALECNGAIILHNTLGESFVPITGCHNIAMPLHEWSEYPRNWINLLNQFDEIWASTEHIREILARARLKSPAFLIPPALDQENFINKKDWKICGRPSFLFVGESHFRKGNHLLVNGYLKAFPKPNMARLTIKTSPDCQWQSPREDITIIKEKWDREKLLGEYCRHDCFTSASLGEGLGLPIAEAIMSGLPVCTNFWGGHKSLLKENSFVRIEHEEILQPYSSDPRFYAEGQKCAYSSPSAITKALLKFLTLNSEQKQKMTRAAKENFLKRYGSEFAKNNIQNRLKEIQKNL